jgi:hypothetical protein
VGGATLTRLLDVLGGATKTPRLRRRGASLT